MKAIESNTLTKAIIVAINEHTKDHQHYTVNDVMDALTYVHAVIEWKLNRRETTVH